MKRNHKKMKETNSPSNVEVHTKGKETIDGFDKGPVGDERMKKGFYATASHVHGLLQVQHVAA